LKVTIDVLEGAEDDSVPSDVADIEDEEQGGYSTAYSQLVHASRTDADPFKDINPKEYLAVSLTKVSRQVPAGTIPQLIASIPANTQQMIGTYFRMVPSLSEPYIV